MKKWSTYQQAVFDHMIDRPRVHLAVDAKAGAGKTTTMVEMTKLVPQGMQTLMCAFNVKIRDELQSRVDSRVTVKTFHQLGFAALIKSWGKVEIDRYRQRDIIRAVLPPKEHLEREDAANVTKLVSMSMARLAKTDQEVDELMDIYDCAPVRLETRQQYISWVQAVLARSRTRGPAVSFDDQVYVPAYFNLSARRFDYIFVDEAQDCNPAQLAIIRNTLRPGGKIIFVGDERQAIYAFRGAGEDTMSRLIESLKADVLPLSITYRCPKKVVRLVNHIVPDLEPAPNASEGEVTVVSEQEMITKVRAGDLVISRTNAAIAKYAMMFLVDGRKSVVLGKDLSTGLVALLNKVDQEDMVSTLDALNEYAHAESERLIAAKKDDKAEDLLDKAEAIRALSEGLKTTGQFRARIDTLFSDTSGEDVITLSTVHKAKGLEFPRVWMLESTFNVYSTEGQNLYYVAATRAMQALYLVQVPRKNGKVPESIGARWLR
jgi:DNA helicase II / ATP-dependent DNA helicase PcrA